MRFLFFLFFVLVGAHSFSQDRDQRARAWADSVVQTLSHDEQIAQLMIIRAHSNLGEEHVRKVSTSIKKYNVGGLCFFQGGPVRQALLTNEYQKLAKTPLFISIDGEWGLAMRLDSVQSLPRQLMLGAVRDSTLAYRYGKILGQQCRRMGIQINYAPVVDVNNNPANPVINDRSLGQDRYKVASFGVQIVKGMQDEGVMACAKHFPGHGDTETDSHYDLPVIKKTKEELDSLELYPFRQLFQNNVGSVMVGHLFIPSIDSGANRPTSLSYANVTKLLRQELNYMGLSITDAMEMKGVTKFFPSSSACVEALLAGNDLLCLPEDIPGAISAINRAIRSGVLSRELIESRVKRVLYAKYQYGLSSVEPIDTAELINDLNAPVLSLRSELATHGITLLRNKGNLLPFNKSLFGLLSRSSKKPIRIGYIAIGVDSANTMSTRMKEELNAEVFFFNYKQDEGNVLSFSEMIKRTYDYVVIGVHNYSRKPEKNFGISPAAVKLVDLLLQNPNAVLFMFGNPYAAKNFCHAKRLFACFEDHPLTQETAYDLLVGKKTPQGTLPVTICDSLRFGTGLQYSSAEILPRNFLPEHLFTSIDSIVMPAIAQGAMPGCVILAARDGKVVYERSFGYTTYQKEEPVSSSSIYDLASITKIAATTLAVMKLYDEGRIDLDKPVSNYLSWTKNNDKGELTIRELLLHESGLKAWIPYHYQGLDTLGKKWRKGFFSSKRKKGYRVQIADELYIRDSWQEDIRNQLLESETSTKGVYVYSDNGFILLGEMVETIVGMDLDAYLRKTLYEPLNLHATGFVPLRCVPKEIVVPTENDTVFRKQLLRGYVHDPTAALFGGISGHAGLFSTAHELAVLMQMLINGGRIGSYSFLRKETVDLFTAYHRQNSRRGLGFDKPEKDNASRTEPYPSGYVSSATFGHTGFTGTATWADPDNGLVFVFLSNRIHPNMNNGLLSSLSIRRRVLDELYRILVKP